MAQKFERIVLIGLSGVGKSSVARLLAERLGWEAIDTDDELEAEFGASIGEVFRRHGEPVFRAAERVRLGAALARSGVVVATGGGAAVEPAVWTSTLLGGAGTLVVALDAQPQTSLRRLEEQAVAIGDAAERPLLVAADPLTRLAALKAERQAMYDAATITLVVDNVPVDAVAPEIADLVSTGGEQTPALRLETPSGSSDIHIFPGSAALLGALVHAQWPSFRRAWIATDESVGPLHAATIEASLAAAGIASRCRAVPVGEGSKSLTGVGSLYDWLLGGGIERGDVLIALGGGVVGDLTGFAAATCLRGVGLVQVPTSLLAMVDSSVGGKTGINHAAGKNLIGAFYQPPLVVIDPLFLRTLPTRELTAGWAEIVKHAVIQRSLPDGERGDLVEFLERNADALLALREPATTYLIGRNVALKAAVVAADEREAGVRAFLNFGHTLGHAIEAAGYQLLHGEAIALGMRAAARIGVAVGTCGKEDVAKIDRLLDRFGLPWRVGLDRDRVLSLLGSDKKRTGGKLHWVLPLRGGGVELRADVPPEAVRDALLEVTMAREG